jgi:hypothetical protein
MALISTTSLRAKTSALVLLFPGPDRCRTRHQPLYRYRDRSSTRRGNTIPLLPPRVFSTRTTSSLLHGPIPPPLPPMPMPMQQSLQCTPVIPIPSYPGLPRRSSRPSSLGRPTPRSALRRLSIPRRYHSKLTSTSMQVLYRRSWCVYRGRSSINTHTYSSINLNPNPNYPFRITRRSRFHFRHSQLHNTPLPVPSSPAPRNHFRKPNPCRTSSLFSPCCPLRYHASLPICAISLRLSRT